MSSNQRLLFIMNFELSFGPGKLSLIKTDLSYLIIKIPFDFFAEFV